MVKRLLDFVVSCLLLVVLAPLVAVIAIAVLLFDGSPVFLNQERAGKSGQAFTIRKFRTMSNDLDEHGRLLPDAQRITGLGRQLRRWHLDELPQLWNIIRGDMSLVGPRPLHTRYLERYSAEQMRRHEVRPGMTGLAQVRGGSKMDWPERLDLDVWYVDNHSLSLDLSILGQTAIRIARSRDTGDSTMEEFVG